MEIIKIQHFAGLSFFGGGRFKVKTPQGFQHQQKNAAEDPTGKAHSQSKHQFTKYTFLVFFLALK